MNYIENYEVREVQCGIETVNNDSGFTKTISYTNYTNEIVYVKDRSGFSVKLNPKYSVNYTGCDGLIVKVQMTFKENEANAHYDRISLKSPTERDEMEKAFYKAYSQSPLSMRQIFVFTSYLLIKKEDLTKDGGVSYIPKIDTNVYIGAGIEKIQSSYPPGSKEYYLHRHIEMCFNGPWKEQFHSAGFVFQIRIVDNDSAILPTYWTSYANEITSIQAVKDANFESGVYVLRSDGSSEHFDMNKYSIAEFRENVECPLFFSREEAKANLSHPEIRIKKDTLAEQESKAKKAEIELQIMREKAENERIKYERERQQLQEKFEMEQRLQQEKNEREKVRLEEERKVHQERIKQERTAYQERHEQDMKSQARKNTSDIIKYGLVIAQVIVTIGMIVFSYYTKTPFRPVKII